MDDLDRKKEELEFLEANRLYWEMRLKFQQRENDQLAKEIAEHERMQAELEKQLEAARHAVGQWLEKAPLGRPN